MAERILIPLDGSEIGETALYYVEELVSKLKPGEKIEVTLFQVLSLPSPLVVGSDEEKVIINNNEQIEQITKTAVDYLDKAGEVLKSKGVTVKCKVAVSTGAASAAEEIIKAEEEIDADLVAMSTHGRRGLTRWAFGSVTEKVLRAGKVPVLMVRAEKTT